MRHDSFSASGESNRHKSTRVAFSEYRAKFTPLPFQVAPSGYGRPGQTRIFINLFLTCAPKYTDRLNLGERRLLRHDGGIKLTRNASPEATAEHCGGVPRLGSNRPLHGAWP